MSPFESSISATNLRLATLANLCLTAAPSPAVTLTPSSCCHPDPRAKRKGRIPTPFPQPIHSTPFYLYSRCSSRRTCSAIHNFRPTENLPLPFAVALAFLVVIPEGNLLLLFALALALALLIAIPNAIRCPFRRPHPPSNHQNEKKRPRKAASAPQKTSTPAPPTSPSSESSPETPHPSQYARWSAGTAYAPATPPARYPHKTVSETPR